MSEIPTSKAEEGDTTSPPPASAPAPEPAVPQQSADGLGNLNRMLDVPLDMTVELGRTQMPLSEVLRLDTGSVITIDRLPGEPIDLLINGKVFARGEVVVVNDTFGFRITELVDPAGGASSLRPRGG